MAEFEKGILTVFISKKEADEIAAKRIRAKLEVYGGDRMKLAMSQDIPKGADWISWIRDRLAEADILFLLFTDPATSWDWCLYEVGLFTPLSDRPAKPIICMHTPLSEPPGPLKHLQCVKGELDTMKDFLRQFFGTGEITGLTPPVNKNFADNEEELTSTAEYICEALVPSKKSDVERIYYSRYMDLVVDPGSLSDDSIPGDTPVRSDPLSLEIFGLLEKPPGGKDWSWRKLEDMMSDDGQEAWMRELTEAAKKACKNEVLTPPRECLRSLTSKKVYKAVIYYRELIAETKVLLRILFVHQPGEQEKTFPADRKGRVARAD